MSITNYKGRQLLTRVTDSYQHEGSMLVTVAVSRAGGFNDAGTAIGYEETCSLDVVPLTIQDLQETACRWIDTILATMQ